MRLSPSLRHNRSGMTLIETVIVLGVFAVIIAAVWLVVSVVYENVRQTTATRNLQTVVQNMRQLMVRSPSIDEDGTSTNTQLLDRQGAFPVDMRVNQGDCISPSFNNCGRLNHPWATNTTGTVTTNAIGTNSATFYIRFASVPKKACIGLATKLSGGEISNLEGVVINGSSFTGTGLPLTVVSANLACNAGANNTIEWRFNIRA
jgi:prepilin-type N-terminal cleavage/methylation domain-containing protein